MKIVSYEISASFGLAVDADIIGAEAIETMRRQLAQTLEAGIGTWRINRQDMPILVGTMVVTATEQVPVIAGPEPAPSPVPSAPGVLDTPMDPQAGVQ